MKLRYGRAGLIAGVAALIGAGACSKDGPVVDDGLTRDLAAATGGSDLELAPKSARSQVVVSAIEGGPTASPKAALTHTSQRRTPRQVVKPAARVATRAASKPSRVVSENARESAPESAPEPVVAQPAPAAARPAPAAIGHQQGRVYKTEAEIFQQMPWIRP